jgi:hypothetical protein
MDDCQSHEHPTPIRSPTCVTHPRLLASPAFGTMLCFHAVGCAQAGRRRRMSACSTSRSFAIYAAPEQTHLQAHRSLVTVCFMLCCLSCCILIFRSVTGNDSGYSVPTQQQHRHQRTQLPSAAAAAAERLCCRVGRSDGWCCHPAAAAAAAAGCNSGRLSQGPNVIRAAAAAG